MVVTLQRGFDLPQRVRRSGEVPIVSSAGITDFHDSPIVQPPGVVTGRYGTIGELFFLTEAFWPLNTTLFVRDFHGNEPHFVYYLLQRFDFKTFSGKSGVPGVNRNDLHREAVRLPVDKEEQRAIAEALSDVDALLGGLDRLIAKKRDLKQAAMQQLLTGETRLPGFHGEWVVKTIGDIVEKIVGGGTPSRANSEFWGNEIPWVTVKDFATFNPRHSQESITRLGLRSSASHLIPAGTLITSTRMALGKAVVYEVDVSINQDLKALFLKPEVSVAYVTYWFEHFGSLIDELGSGSTVKGISLVELRRFPFQAPPQPEQTAIASVLSEMAAELAVLEQRREKARALKQAMMQELLTGRTRLVSRVDAEATA
ncbi:MAG: restriction endonuclease subunit S [Xanthomonadales bacterium]|nr:restriction endonuclease subunit S [Xanthomonadales bacterium]